MVNTGDGTFIHFSLIEPAWLRREMHLHTNYTDGKPSIAQVIQRAEKLGLAEIAFTEHVRADSEWFPGFAQEVRSLAASSPVRVLVGAEVRIKDFQGTLDISPEIRRHCDIVLASVHRFPGRQGERLEFQEIERDRFAEIEYRLALGFLKNGGANVLAHPGGMSLRRLEHFPEDYFASLMEEAARAAVAMEINSSYHHQVFDQYLAQLKKHDPLVSVGSDVHELERLGECSVRLKEILWKA
ncbi:histidinol-phosphatase [Desulfuromonas versatilis]|uniref:Histidinol-phosphatase n=1 Tax=Desulfuromonas versatilis TaxID=2802975 RepID=A0ABM8HXH0_9BACT|nr:PHP domain-containing protein [Desulfuromonas versatilis]BCR05810.1 histidinol-phosphatase [Desulfuromonas versatilis]